MDVIAKFSFSKSNSSILISLSFTLSLIGTIMTGTRKKKKKESYSSEIRYMILLNLFFITIGLIYIPLNKRCCSKPSYLVLQQHRYFIE